VAELALDQEQRDAFVGDLDRVRVAQLMGCEASPHASGHGRPAHVGADDRG
jgi:hypothetical protein